MEGTSHVARPATSATIEVADDAEASSESDLNDVYVDLVDDTISSSGDEFDHDEEL